MFNLSEDQLYGDTKEEIDERWGMSPRTIIQRFGTEFGQYNIYKIYPELKTRIKSRCLWISLFKQFMEKNKNKKIVISDVRFKNEVDFIDSVGGYIIKLNRPLNIIDNHISELEINTIPSQFIKTTIDNDKTLTDLYNKIDNLLLVPF